MKRNNLIEKLEAEGYPIVWRKYGYWDNQPCILAKEEDTIYGVWKTYLFLGMDASGNNSRGIINFDDMPEKYKTFDYIMLCINLIKSQKNCISSQFSLGSANWDQKKKFAGKIYNSLQEDFNM
jgi:hypothetical protein